MKKFLKYILLLLPLALAACTDDLAESGEWGGVEAGEDEIVLRFYAQFPEPTATSTRAIGETPDYDKLDLYCLVFTDDGSPARNYLRFISKKAVCDPPENKDGLTLVPFTVALGSTNENAIIHFIAVDSTIPDSDNPVLNLDFGPENVLIPNMAVSGGHDAYWQRIALGMPINTSKADKIAELVSATSPVPLIRNFAKVSVTLDEKVGDDEFELQGFCVINTLDRGTVAPYNENIGFPEFVDLKNGRTPYNYNYITNTIGYSGTRAAGAKVVDPGKVPADEGDNYNTTPKYMYERPFSTTNHTYVIVKGIYKEGDLGKLGHPTFYKLDLGAADALHGVFTFSNMLRNFNFVINITSVTADGYATTEDAAKGLIYNNNISAALETQHLLSISDGKDMMYVNFTSMVIVEQQEELELWFRYFHLGDSMSDDKTQQVFRTDPKGGVECLEIDEDRIEGEVIESAEFLTDIRTETVMQGTTSVDRKWEVLKIKTKKPGAEQKYQTITLYYQNGLSRTISFFMKTPWELENAATYPGQYDDRESRPDSDVNEGHVSEKAGQNLTIFFELPKNLPKAMFPLEFVIESNRLNIENDKAGTIAVQSGPSMFVDGEIRIQYVKTVRWEEYDTENDANYSSNKDYIGNVVRCRFLTITDLNDSAISQTETTVRIRNQYFKDLDVNFTRDLE